MLLIFYNMKLYYLYINILFYYYITYKDEHCDLKLLVMCPLYAVLMKCIF